MNPQELSTTWRERAQQLRRYSEPAANAWVEAARELDLAFTQWELEALTLEQASEESGYSYGHLQRLVSEGVIPNISKPGAPRVRRGDLPRRTDRRPQPREQDVDLADEILPRRTR